jgi:hypothetical protein
MPRKEFESFTRLDASDVNTFLMDQSVQSFADSTARASAIITPVEGMVTYLNDIDSLSVYNGTDWTTDRTIQVFAGTAARGSAIPSPVEGMYTHINETDSLEYYDGSAWEGVGGGGGGAILQVVSATSSTNVTNNSSTYVSTGLSASITPSSTSSKVMILARTHAVNPNNAAVATFTIFRGTVSGTDLAANTNGFAKIYMSAAGNLDTAAIATFIDSPNTTSATTYTFAFKNILGASGAISVQAGTTTGSIILMEVAG